jgi:hypothetical protein
MAVYDRDKTDVTRLGECREELADKLDALEQASDKVGIQHIASGSVKAACDMLHKTATMLDSATKLLEQGGNDDTPLYKDRVNQEPLGQSLATMTPMQMSLFQSTWRK